MILYQPWPRIALHLLVGMAACVFEIRVWRRSRGVVLPRDRGFGPRVWIGGILGYAAAVHCDACRAGRYPLAPTQEH